MGRPVALRQLSARVQTGPFDANKRLELIGFRRKLRQVQMERDKRQRPMPVLVKQQFADKDINQLWVADMTYVPTWDGFLYLAVVTDVYSRKVVISALNMALHPRRPESVLHHSDKGRQGGFNRCREMGVRPSMGNVGGACDNAMAESCFASLECELITRHSWRKKTEARMAVFTWIESWHNPHKLHCALDYQSPNNFERKHNKEAHTVRGNGSSP